MLVDRKLSRKYRNLQALAPEEEKEEVGTILRDRVRRMEERNDKYTQSLKILVRHSRTSRKSAWIPSSLLLPRRFTI